MEFKSKLLGPTLETLRTWAPRAALNMVSLHTLEPHCQGYCFQAV